MFVPCSYPRFDCKLNASLFDLHGLSFVFSILYQSAGTERTCKLCSLGVEHEAHFILYCPVLDWSRQKYLRSKFYVSPNINKFNVLMSTKNETIINDVAKYLYLAFKFRKMLIDSLLITYRTRVHGIGL